MNYIVYLIFRFFIFTFSALPFPLLYGFSSFLAFIVGRVLKYRQKIIYQNLTNSFPEMSHQQKKKIIHKFYINLTDLLVEGIKSFSMTKKQIYKHIVVLNPEILDDLYKKGKGVIGNTGHFGNWEWAALTSSFYLKHQPVGFYKPLSNKHLDKYLKKNRSRFGMHLCSIYVTAIAFESYKDKSAFFAMVGDQSPSKVETAYWFNFLNQKTAFIHGAERYAKRYDMAVAFLNIQRVKRGYYTVEIIKITDEPKLMPESEITRIYMENLEKIIKQNPENWLWSHRRWKIKTNEKSIIRNP